MHTEGEMFTWQDITKKTETKQTEAAGRSSRFDHWAQAREDVSDEAEAGTKWW